MEVIINPIHKAIQELLYMETCLYMEYTLGHKRIHTPTFWEAFDNWIV